MTHSFENFQHGGRFPTEDLRIFEKSIRRILRASDLQSKALVKAVGLTAPQLVILKAIAALGEVTTTALSAHADLSAATVITILDKLEERSIIERYRSSQDRRIVHTRLTEKGRALVANAPEPLGQEFVERFSALTDSRRREIIGALMEVADMMSRGQPREVSISESRPNICCVDRTLAKPKG